MFGIGPGELLLLLVLALIVLGPERMPKVARDLGRVVGDLRRTSDELRDEFLNADRSLDKATDATARHAPAEQASIAPPTPPVDPNETAFDREMREARERIKRKSDGPSDT